jgi:hypothetical protein
MMGTMGSPKTSINDYQHVLCDNPEEKRPHLHNGSSLKSHLLEKFISVPSDKLCTCGESGFIASKCVPHIRDFSVRKQKSEFSGATYSLRFEVPTAVLLNIQDIMLC